ncbi:MAG: hypothetical protein IPK10_09515 [Bacteroidetes bacterium]|nr:hypothetical protein [Bacteroidota bacterium]
MAKTPTLYYFTLVMSGLYVVLGLFVMFSPGVAEFLPGWKHWVMGLMLIGYAYVRFRRLKKLKDSMETKLDDLNRN